MGACSVVLTALLLSAVALSKVSASRFIYGKEAEKLCQAYKKVCPRGKVCAIQTMLWPRNMKFPVCVHEHHVHVRSRVCEQAPSPGGCAASFRRWYYNVHVASCSWFTYGGCGGNDNNFRSREECEKVCVKGRAQHATTTPRHPNRPHHQRHRQDRRRDDVMSPVESPADRTHHATTNDSDSRLGASVHRTWNQDDFSRDNSPFDTNNPPYTAVPPAITHPNWRQDNKDGWRRVTQRPPLELRHPPEEHRRIRTKPRPLYRPYDGGPSNPSAAFELGSDNDAPVRSYRYQDKRTGVSTASRQRGEYNRNARLLAEASDKTRLLTDVSEGNRNFPNTRERLASLTAKLPTATIKRRPSGRRQPLRQLSLLNREPAPAPRQNADITAALTSPPRSSYAADANETIRRFPKRRERKRGKGLKKKKKNRRRRRKNRTRNRKQRKGRKTVAPLPPSSNDDGVTVESNSTTSTGRNSTAPDMAGRFAEYRRGRTIFSPEKTQSDEANLLQQTGRAAQPSAEDGTGQEKKKRRRRRRRRRRKGKGKGKKKERRMKKGKDESEVTVATGGDEEGEKKGGQYYANIQLFGLLGSPRNETGGSLT